MPRPASATASRIKGTGCTLPYLPVHEVEAKVAAAYGAVRVTQLGPDTATKPAANANGSSR